MMQSNDEPELELTDNYLTLDQLKKYITTQLKAIAQYLGIDQKKQKKYS